MPLRVSVVIATRNRGASIRRLIDQLNAQTLDTGAFEIIVVDDGSDAPVAPHLVDKSWRVSPRVQRIAWSGPAVARHQGASTAAGDILVFLDDDMQVGPGFLAAQIARHDAVAHSVVLGRMRADPGLARMPLFERYHARQLDRWRQGMIAGQQTAQGIDLCTGNVSMTRADYFRVGGFDASLRRSEDRELGIRLEQAGCALVYADEVESVHSSDHASLGVWLRRAFLYGQFDLRIARMHPDVTKAHPWRFWSLINPLSRPIVGVALVAPWAGRALSRVAYGAAVVADRMRLANVALTGTAFAYALQYFAGLRTEYGSLSALRQGIGTANPAAPATSAFKAFRLAVRADHDAMRQHREKYHGEHISRAAIVPDLVTKIGFQMLVVYRVMRLFDEWHLSLVAMVISRAIRHLYAAEIHWKMRMAPGVSLVHGLGLVLGKDAEVGEGCILFQGVTLGENIDARSGVIGAPHLGRHVHVGPNATLVGPITIGDRSKISAGAVLTSSVPEESLVALPESTVTPRRRPSAPIHQLAV